jgi:hypothetical protein
MPAGLDCQNRTSSVVALQPTTSGMRPAWAAKTEPSQGEIEVNKYHVGVGVAVVVLICLGLWGCGGAGAPGAPAGGVGAASVGAASLPATHISSVVISGEPENYTLTIKGAGFGTLAGTTLPQKRDTDDLIITTDATNIEWGYTGDTAQLTYQSWTDSQIVVTGLGVPASAALELAVWNPSTGLGATWGGNTPGNHVTHPTITSVTFSGTGANLHITVQGTGFGVSPLAHLPNTCDVAGFFVTDWRVHWTNGGTDTYEAGHNGNTIHLRYHSWSPTQIVIYGFAGTTFGDGIYMATSGDPITIGVKTTGEGPAHRTVWGGFIP